MTVAIPPELQGPIDAIQALCEKRGEVRRRLTVAIAGRDPNAELPDELMTAFADSEPYGSAPSKKLLTKLLTKVRNWHDKGIIQDVGIRVLQARERELTAKSDDARVELLRVMQAWAQKRVADATARVLALTEAYVQALAEPFAVGRIHADPAICTMMRESRLTHLGTKRDLFQPVSSGLASRHPVMVLTAKAEQAILTAVESALRQK